MRPCDTAGVQLSRRRFLALSATVLVACSGDDEAAPSPTGASTPGGTAGRASTTEPTTPPTATSAPTTDVAATDPTTTTTTEPAVELAADPFALGVGSGDPDDRSVALWTRLVGDLPDEAITVTWELTPDVGEATSGTVEVDASSGHAVHVVVDVDGPSTYAFSAGGWTSPSGRTAPLDPAAGEVRLASASCQHLETGFYAAHRDLAEWAPDLVLFLGDFVYEGDARPVGDGIVRSHEGPEPTDLDGYRARYATYLADPDLQAARAAAPWLAIWDDHEVDNDYAGLTSQDRADPAEFARRRAEAYRAWWEHTPTRLGPPDASGAPDAPYDIYRGADVGDLLRISALDGRQFRSDQLAESRLDPSPPPPGWDDPSRTMLGEAQEAWLAERFSSSGATWNCLAQQTVLADTRLGDGVLNYDQWDGYVPARQRLLDEAPPGLVTLTGDIHLAGVALLGDPGAPVGVELITTSISSRANVPPELVGVVTSIPSIVDAELERRGYLRHVVTPDAWTAEFRSVVDVTDPASEVVTWKTFRVAAGTPGVVEV